MRYIKLDNGKVRELAVRAKASRMAVWRALHFKSDTELSQWIRDTAVSELGGREVELREVEEGFVPNCTFVVERDQDEIVSTSHIFPRSVVVVTDTRAEVARIYLGGEMVDRRPCANVQEQMCALYEAQQMSDMMEG